MTGCKSLLRLFGVCGGTADALVSEASGAIREGAIPSTRIMVYDVLVVVVGVLIAEVIYDQYRRWQKQRRMRMLNRLSQLKRKQKRDERAASIPSDAPAS